jgi:hypothetical protein
MLEWLRTRLTYANVVATLAVFLALGGGAWALTLGRNSVGSPQIRRNAVKAPEIGKDAVRKAEIRANAVRTDEVADGSLLRKDFAAGEVPGQGEPGPPGENATKLFGYIRDNGPDIPALVYYGSGVNSVSDEPGNGTGYVVTFNQSLKGCVVLADPGIGFPEGEPVQQHSAYPSIELDFMGAPSDVRVTWYVQNGTQTAIRDTSFMISAFC